MLPNSSRSGEQRLREQRTSQMKGNLNLMSLGATLLVVVLMILGLSYAAPSNYYSRIAIGAAVVLLVLRQVTRRRRGARSKAAEPDPQSRIDLHS